jgi:thiol-disulfide isomerase/thioredoxin
MKPLALLLCSLVLVTAASAEGKHVKGVTPLVISQGKAVELADFLVTGKITVFDFTSEYCGPCRGYTDLLLHLHQQRADVAVVKVDINRPEFHKIDWDSPVAKQYGMESIPHFKVYGPDGKLMADDRPARLMVDQWIAALH